ncbi:MAG TPA: hypothetical protein VGI04_12410 [Neobacillus sp.]|jgi:hypothetical protein
MKKIIFTLTTLTLLSGFTFFIAKTFAAKDVGAKIVKDAGTTTIQEIDYKQLYQDAISYGALNPEIKSYEQWVKENEEQFLPVYKDALDQHLFEPPLSYGEWLKLNNYGQPPGSGK